MLSFRHLLLPSICLFTLAVASATARADHDGKLQILLMGDSTCIGSICRKTDPDAHQLEDVIRDLLKADNDIPATNVINQGRDGEFVHGLLTLGRYDRDIKPLPGLDYVLIRYGLNDRGKRKDFAKNFPNDLRELMARLRQDHPGAELILMPTFPYFRDQRDEDINTIVRAVAESENVPLLDVHERFAAELKAAGPQALTYRRVPLKNVPEKYHLLIRPAIYGQQVIAMGNRYDAHLKDVPGWFSDRHPNLAGYHVIGDETAKFLAPLIKKRLAEKNAASTSDQPTVRVAGIVLKWIRTEKETNYQRAEALIREAAAGGAKIVVTTESFLDGYAIADKSIPLPRYRALGEPIPDGEYFKKLAALADELDIHLVAGMMEADGDKRYNTAVFINPEGELVGKYRKQKLQHELVRNTPGDRSLVFDSPFGKTGLMICADRTEQSIVGRFNENGAEFLICPSGGMFGPRRNDPIVQSRSRQNGKYIVFVHPAEFLVTAPDGTIKSRTILGDRLLIPKEEIDGPRDQNRVFYFELPVSSVPGS
ncbi:nitrilase-related carbon-nitrogen hydrolase [Symmachiella dynata]|uniref:nitrilase-related carbon-nitrogen hydrolase n=1 Tax=Symmachiella dynata TaxID=2527995 RepID=UPI0030EC72AC